MQNRAQVRFNKTNEKKVSPHQIHLSFMDVNDVNDRQIQVRIEPTSLVELFIWIRSNITLNSRNVVAAAKRDKGKTTFYSQFSFWFRLNF